MCIGALFGGGQKIPELPPVVAPPEQVDYSKAVAAGTDVKKKALVAQGLGSTIKTSPMGISSPAEMYGKTLLGQ